MNAPLSRARRLLLLAVLGVPAVAAAVEVGDRWENSPPAELGRPAGRLEAGAKVVYRWPELQVTVEEGRVVQVRRLDVAAEAAAAERRAAALAAEKARLAAQREERNRAEAAAAKRAELDRMERDRAEREAKIAALEAENARQANTVAELASRRTEERAARQASLEKEMSVLRLELTRARADGDSQKALRVSAALRAKADEWRLLREARP